MMAQEKGYGHTHYRRLSISLELGHEIMKMLPACLRAILGRCYFGAHGTAAGYAYLGLLGDIA